MSQSLTTDLFMLGFAAILYVYLLSRKAHATAKAAKAAAEKANAPAAPPGAVDLQPGPRKPGAPPLPEPDPEKITKGA